MNERKLYQVFKEKIHKADPNCFCYKIPDWVGGGKRPFDFFLVIKGIPFALEFKSKGGLLTKYQDYQLVEFILAGGEALVFREGEGTMDLFIEKILEKIEERRLK